MMNKQNVLKWMNNQIKAYKLATEVVEGLKNIGVYDKTIHVSADGILDIVKANNCKCSIKNRKTDEDYPYKITVSYKGFKFFCLMSDKELNEFESKI